MAQPAEQVTPEAHDRVRAGSFNLSTLATALNYAARFDLPVFPARLVFRDDGKVDKVPYVKWRDLPAAPNLRQIEAWWQKHPDALICTPAGKRSRLILLDIDIKGGRNGFDTLDDLGKPILPETPIAHSRSGGVHLYFADHTDIEIRNSEGEDGLGVGLDVRGEGGMIVLPSPGSGYTWDPHYNLDTHEPLPAPFWLGHKKERKDRPAGTGRGFASPTAILDGAIANIHKASGGTRHGVILKEVYTVAGLAAAGRLDAADARQRLSAAVISMVLHSGGDLPKAERDFADAWKHGFAKPLHRARRAGR
jgi:hypothetical protein